MVGQSSLAKAAVLVAGSPFFLESGKQDWREEWGGGGGGGQRRITEKEKRKERWMVIRKEAGEVINMDR